jgi:hypothetical protein
MSRISLSEKSFFTLEPDLELLPFSPPCLSPELSSSFHFSLEVDLFPLGLVGDRERDFSPRGTSNNQGKVRYGKNEKM